MRFQGGGQNLRGPRRRRNILCRNWLLAPHFADVARAFAAVALDRTGSDRRNARALLQALELWVQSCNSVSRFYDFHAFRSTVWGSISTHCHRCAWPRLALVMLLTWLSFFFFFGFVFFILKKVESGRIWFGLFFRFFGSLSSFICILVLAFMCVLCD